MNILRRIFRKIHRTLFTPHFELRGARHALPSIDAACQFVEPSRIALGDDVRFERGAMALADPKGEISLGDRVIICRYCLLLAAGGKIEIGRETLIGDFCSLYGEGGLTIGTQVMIAAGCRLIPNEHTFLIPERPIIEQPYEGRGISIGDGAWLGANVCVLDGVRIGKGAIIGAGAVVTHDIPDYAIAAGVPARVMKMRPGHETGASASSELQN